MKIKEVRSAIDIIRDASRAGHQHQLVIKKGGWRWIKPPQALKGID